MDNSKEIQDIELNIKQAQVLVDTGNAWNVYVLTAISK